MKHFQILFLLAIFILTGCGNEQFGTVPQNTSTQADNLKLYTQLSCSSFTLIKPKVDILYVVDNSTSSYYVASDIQSAIRNTVNTISQEFDYRVIGTSLLPTPGDSTPFNDYQILTNSTDSLSSEASSRKVISASELNFFSNPVSGTEMGLSRINDFISNNISNGLFRQKAYLLTVIISNGRDVRVEVDSGFGNGETRQDTSAYNQAKSNLLNLKTQLESEQFRLFSVTAKLGCTKAGWLTSEKSYIQMSKDLYTLSGSTDSETNKDSYDLCGNGLSTIFTAVNNSIKQILIPHKYKYWPITFTNGEFDKSKLKVFKSSPNTAPVELTSGWQYFENPNYPNGINTRIEPSAGEPTTARHLIEFSAGNEINYPDCVSISSTSKTEYFGYAVLPKEPKVETISLRINGQPIAQSMSNGWTYVGNRMNQNIKVPFPEAGDELPAVNKTGFMLKLNGSSNYYKSGDNVEVYYIPAGI